MRLLRASALGVLGATHLLLAACTALGPGFGFPREPLRISEIAREGDPARRASHRLILRGLEEDAQARPAAAIAHYERALQVDPTNPFAYLALARHEIDAGAAQRALAFLGKAEALLEAEAGLAWRAEPHLIGLRGAALYDLGRHAEASPLLAEARQLAPGVWADGQLDAWELR